MYVSKKLGTELKMAALCGKLESVLKCPHLPKNIPLDNGTA
jgi:hypothetical protein